MKNDNQEGPLTACIAILMILSTVAIAGCVNSALEPQDKATSGGVVQTGSPAPGMATKNDPEYISVNPVGDKNRGDKFTITGTTNLPVGKELQVTVYAKSYEKPMHGSGEFRGAVGIVDVLAGSEGVNTWSTDLDTTTFAPTEYLVNVSVFTGDVSNGDFSTSDPVGRTTFMLNPATDASTPFITIDPIGDKQIGDLVVISGTTNLPEKTTVYLYRTFGNTGEEKLVSNREVFAGSDGINRVRFVSDSSGFDPGSYSVTVTTGKKDVKGSAQFTLSGTSLRPASVIYYAGAKKSSTSTPAITVNPVADHKQGDFFLITGTSSLEEGTLLLCDIHPVYFDDATKKPATVYKGPSGTAGDTIVVRGTGGLNKWSFALDTNAFEKTDYVVNVTTVNEDFTVREIFGRTQFSLT